MRLLCVLSNVIANEPVISPVSGNLFERRLICKYLKENDNRDPINGARLEEHQLITLNEASLQDAAGSREDDCSVAELVRLLQEQWDAMTLERFKLSKDVNQLNKDVNQLTKQLSASVREREREKEVLLSQQNELYKIIDILNGKLTKYRQLDEERKRSSSTDRHPPKSDNVYSNLPTIDNKENINFSSSINSSNGSSFRCGTEHATQSDHSSRFGHLPGHCLKGNSTNGHHSPNFSSINSKFSDTNVYFNEHHLGFAKFDDLPSPKFNGLIGSKFSDHLPSGAKFSALPSPRLESLANPSKFFDLTNCKSNTLKSPKCSTSKLPSAGGHSPSSFQKYNKLSYSTEYVNLNSNRLFDRNQRTQSVIIQNDTLFDSELASMRSYEENLNGRVNDHSNAVNNFLMTPSSSGSLKRYGSNGSTFNRTLSSNGHCSNNYVNTGSRPVEEGIYCNLPVIGGEFADPAGLTSRRAKSTMTNYENILMFDDNPRNGPNGKQLENCTKPDKNEAKNGQDEMRSEMRSEARSEVRKKAKEDCSAKVSNIESWSKDFKNLLNDRIGKMAFSVSLKH